MFMTKIHKFILKWPLNTTGVKFLNISLRLFPLIRSFSFRKFLRSVQRFRNALEAPAPICFENVSEIESNFSLQ